jgi:transketolase
MTKAALDAAELLAAEGIEARVLNVASLRPLDEEAIAAAARETGAIVTAEDHNIFGGLGSAVAQATARTHPVPIAFVGMTRYGTSGVWNELLEYFELTPERIAREARTLVGAKRG